MMNEHDIEVAVFDMAKCPHDCDQCKSERSQITSDYKKLYQVYLEVKALVDRGYDGSFMGEEVLDLFYAVRGVES